MKDKIEDKLDEILEEHISEEDERMEFRLVVYDYMAMRGKILTLIQEERKNNIKVVWNEVCEKIKDDSVREFVKYMAERKMSNFYIDELMEEYLESEGKK